jgi:hypothetical protein
VKRTPTDCAEVLRNALGSYESEHPHWREEVLVSLIDWALRRLEFYVESEEEADISWESPFVELHFPVELDWKAQANAHARKLTVLSGTITRQNTADKARALKTLSEIMVRHLNVLALQEFTNHAWFEKRGETFTPFLSFDADREVKIIRSAAQRRRALEELFRSFAIGGANIEIKTRRDGSLTKKSERALRGINNLLDIPSLSFTGDLNGRPVNIALIFQIHPLIADCDLERAYYPIVVGLFIPPVVVNDDISTDTPASWPADDRMLLWGELHGEIQKLAKHLVPTQELRHSTVVSVNAELEIAEFETTTGRNAAVEAVTQTLAKVGKIRELNFRLNQPDLQGVGASVIPSEVPAKPPATFQEAFVRLLWQSRLRTPVLALIIIILAVFAVYAAQPSEVKLRLWKEGSRLYSILFHR